MCGHLISTRAVGLVVKYLVAIEMPRVRFPDGALFFLYLLLLTHLLHIDSFISLFYIEPTIYLSTIRRTYIHTTTLTLALTIFDDQLHICDDVYNCRSNVGRYTVGRLKCDVSMCVRERKSECMSSRDRVCVLEDVIRA